MCKSSCEATANISCGICLNTYHCGCMGLSRDAAAEIQKSKVRITCVNCASLLDQFGGSFAEVLNKVLDLKSEVDTLKKQLASGVTAGGGSGGLSPTGLNEVFRMVRAEIEEANDRKQRSKNVMVFGLAECSEANESENVMKVLDKIGISRDGTEGFSRVGSKREGVLRPRPIRIKFKSMELKIDALKGAKKLRSAGEEFTKVFLSADFTKRQQEEMKKLVEEKKRRVGDGERVSVRWNWKENKAVIVASSQD
jgi:hypothetical protein